ncbi:RNA-binding S4 domain-containing protein [Demequina litorisediminis]|uniref:RNA-binding S4 domain-containing protein n=1 Tax=Demequina litorisediminis TaxID=1849022 RepID=UPI0032AF4253
MDSGGIAKERIRDGEVTVNGEEDLRRGRRPRWATWSRSADGGRASSSSARGERTGPSRLPRRAPNCPRTGAAVPRH